MECACCKKSINMDEDSFSWKERHVNLIKSEMTGYSRKDTYRFSQFEDEVCVVCYRKLKRNSIIVPIVFWLVLIGAPICAYFLCGSWPVFQRLTYLCSGIAFFFTLIDSDLSYSIIGFILRPLLGVYNLHPLGNKLTRNEQKEYDLRQRIERKAERLERKAETVYGFILMRFKPNYSDFFKIKSYLCLEEELEKNKRFRFLSASKIADILVPDKKSFDDLLFNARQHVTTPFYSYSLDELISMREMFDNKRFYGLDAEEIYEIMEKEKRKDF